MLNTVATMPIHTVGWVVQSREDHSRRDRLNGCSLHAFLQEHYNFPFWNKLARWPPCKVQPVQMLAGWPSMVSTRSLLTNSYSSQKLPCLSSHGCCLADCPSTRKESGSASYTVSATHSTWPQNKTPFQRRQRLRQCI